MNDPYFAEEFKNSTKVKNKKTKVKKNDNSEDKVREILNNYFSN